MIRPARLGILGGTFDPVHVGHVQTALAARDALGLYRVLLMPSRAPVHRPAQPVASRYHRFAMAALAVQGIDALELSDLELRERGPTYTFDTLTRLHASGLEPSQIFFLTGADAFAEIRTWHRYPAVLDLANFAIVARPGHPPERLPALLPEIADRMRAPAADGAAPASPAIFLVNAPTPDVASSDIRQRLREGRPVTGLLAPAVEAHIRRHRLYSVEASAPLLTTADQLHGQD